jgi:hypothetical protein
VIRFRRKASADAFPRGACGTINNVFVSKLTPTVSGIVTVLWINTNPVGAIGGNDGRECGVSVDIEATDPPRGQASHDAQRYLIIAGRSTADGRLAPDCPVSPFDFYTDENA